MKVSMSYPDISILMVPGEIEHVIQSQHPRRNLSEVHSRIHVILHKYTQTQAWLRGKTHSSHDSMTRIVITQRVSYCILSSWVEIRRVLNWFHCSNCRKSPWFINGPVYPQWMTKAQQAFCKCYDCDIGSLCSTRLLQTNLRFSENVRWLALRMRALCGCLTGFRVANYAVFESTCFRMDPGESEALNKGTTK